MKRVPQSRVRTATPLAVILLFSTVLLPGSAHPKEPAGNEEVPTIRVRTPPIQPVLIQVDVDMVLLNVSVTDEYGRVVTGFEARNFRLYDEKVEQQIIAFSAEDTPIAVGLIFDSSGSMSDKIQKSKEAVTQFFKTSNPQDEFLLINFSERFRQVSGFTSKYEDLQNSLLAVKTGGRTMLLDAIYLGLDQMRKSSTSRKALVVISDGGENDSRYTQRDIKRAMKESDVQVYALGIFEPLGYRTRTPEEANGPVLLAQLAETSGGRMFGVEDPNELPDIMEKISMELRHQYVLGYKPSNLLRDGSWRHVKVKLAPPKGLPPLQLYTRTGYYAPTR